MRERICTNICAGNEYPGPRHCAGADAPTAARPWWPTGSWAAAPTAATACLSLSRAASAPVAFDARQAGRSVTSSSINAVLTLRRDHRRHQRRPDRHDCPFMNGNLFPGYSFEAALCHPHLRGRRPQLHPPHLRRGGLCAAAATSCPSSNPTRATPPACSAIPIDYPQPVAGEGHFISTYVSRTVPPSPALRGSRCASPSTGTTPTSSPTSCGRT